VRAGGKLLAVKPPVGITGRGAANDADALGLFRRLAAGRSEQLLVTLQPHTSVRSIDGFYRFVCLDQNRIVLTRRSISGAHSQSPANNKRNPGNFGRRSKRAATRNTSASHQRSFVLSTASIASFAWTKTG
jgi:hypothetical protein